MNDLEVVNTLSGALPAGIRYEIGKSHWNAIEIGEFQARKLAEDGYRLVHEDELRADRWGDDDD